MFAKHKTVTRGIVCESTGSVNRLGRFAEADLIIDSICFARIHSDLISSVRWMLTGFLLLRHGLAPRLSASRDGLSQSSRAANNVVTRDLVNRSGSGLAHNRAQFAAQDFEYGFDARLAERGQPPRVRPPYPDG